MTPGGALHRAPGDLAYAVALASLPGIGPATMRRLLARSSAREGLAALAAGVPLAALAGTRAPGRSQAVPVARRDLAALAGRLDVAACWDRVQAAGITVLRSGDPGFPTRLGEDPEAPPLLFCRGSLPNGDLPSVAVIGTRSCTRYGEEVAAEIAGELSRRGVVVVSGLAGGIDAAAHAGALAASGSRPRAGPAAPLAIVGGGVDVVYPAANAPLWRAVAAEGAIVSEAPPGCAPEAWRFPQRNRLLAAASDFVLVVESHRRGGALLTAELALRRQRPVGAVPGSVRSPASAGCNDLLADGAHVVRDAEDVVAVLGLGPRHPRAQPPVAAEVEIEGDRPDEAALRALEHRPLGLDELMARTGQSLLETAEALERLQERGLVRRAGAGFELAG